MIATMDAIHAWSLARLILNAGSRPMAAMVRRAARAQPPTRRAETRSLFLLIIMLWPRSQHGKKLGAARAQVGVGMSV